MKKRMLALFLSFALCVSLIPAAFAAGKSYEEAVKEFQAGDLYETEQSFESDYGTVFIYSNGPNPRGQHGFLAFIAKAPCAKGEGAVVGLPTPRNSLMCLTKPPQTAVLSEDGKTFTYTYHYDEALVTPYDQMLRAAGDFIYTLDLTTGEVTAQEPQIPEGYHTYAAALERAKTEEGWTVEQTLEAPACTVLLRYFTAEDGRRSYFLDFVYKKDVFSYEEGMVVSHILTITKNDGTGQDGFPVYYTHRAPDTLTLNEDKTLLTYTYTESLEGGPDAETLELATGLSSKLHTLPSAEPTETQPSAPAEFTDVPAGSWFEEGVKTCAQAGVMIGTGADAFSPEEKLSQAECLTLAFRLYDLMREEEHIIETAPEDWGRMTLTLADGTTFSGYGHQSEGENQVFSWWANRTNFGAPYALVPGSPYQDDTDLEAGASAQQAWMDAHPEICGHDVPATMTLNGVTYQGTTDCWMPVFPYVFQFRPEGEDDRGDVLILLHHAVFREVGPDRWWRDTAYTITQRGLEDIFDPVEFSVYPATRSFFAQLIADACEGHLEKINTIGDIPDLPREFPGPVTYPQAELYRDAAYALYEAGILTGVDETGTFAADATLTRAEAAVMVARTLDKSQRVTTPSTSGDPYAAAVAKLRSGPGHSNEQAFETDDCTIFVYDRGGFMNAPHGMMTVIYKAGSPLGAGTAISLPYARIDSGLAVCHPADTMTLSEDGKTFTYTYHREEDIVYDGTVLEEAGIITYTTDLTTGETSMSHSPFSYENRLEQLTNEKNYTVELKAETPAATLLLRWKPISSIEETRDYELWLIHKQAGADPVAQRLLLPSTAVWGGYWRPTDRSPDSLTLNVERTVLTYTYTFDQALKDGEDILHQAGTYTYTVDVATGELTVTHTED